MNIIDDVKARITGFGCIMVSSDDWVLGFIKDKVENEIKNNCNIVTIPDELYNVEVDRISGEFLLCKKNSGQLTGVELETSIKSIQEGDTTITYNSDMTAEQKFDSLISYLMHNEIAYSTFRQIKW